MKMALIITGAKSYGKYTSKSTSTNYVEMAEDGTLTSSYGKRLPIANLLDYVNDEAGSTPTMRFELAGYWLTASGATDQDEAGRICAESNLPFRRHDDRATLEMALTLAAYAKTRNADQ